MGLRTVAGTAALITALAGTSFAQESRERPFFDGIGVLEEAIDRGIEGTVVFDMRTGHYWDVTKEGFPGHTKDDVKQLLDIFWNDDMTYVRSCHAHVRPRRPQRSYLDASLSELPVTGSYAPPQSEIPETYLELRGMVPSIPDIPWAVERLSMYYLAHHQSGTLELCVVGKSADGSRLNIGVFELSPEHDGILRERAGATAERLQNSDESLFASIMEEYRESMVDVAREFQAEYEQEYNNIHKDKLFRRALNSTVNAFEYIKDKLAEASIILYDASLRGNDLAAYRASRR